MCFVCLSAFARVFGVFDSVSLRVCSYMSGFRLSKTMRFFSPGGGRGGTHLLFVVVLVCVLASCCVVVVCLSMCVCLCVADVFSLLLLGLYVQVLLLLCEGAFVCCDA